MKKVVSLLIALMTVMAVIPIAEAQVQFVVSGGSGSGGGGTVTDVNNGTISAMFSASWATTTTTPRFSLDFAAQSGRKFLASPSDGSSAVPSFRIIAAADIPTLNQSTTGNAATASASDHSITSCAASNWVTGLSTAWALTCSRPTCADLVNAAASCSTDATNASNISSGTLATSRMANCGSTANALQKTGTSGCTQDSTVKDTGSQVQIGTATTADSLSDVLFGASAAGKKILVLQAKASATQPTLELQSSAGNPCISIGASTAVDGIGSCGSIYELRLFSGNASASGGGLYLQDGSSHPAIINANTSYGIGLSANNVYAMALSGSGAQVASGMGYCWNTSTTITNQTWNPCINRLANGVLSVATVQDTTTVDGSWRVKYYEAAVGSNVASAATITPTSGLFHVTGTTQITTINLPRTGFTGCLKTIPDGAFTTSTGGNIALASTAVVSKVLEFCYDGTSWFPSY